MSHSELPLGITECRKANTGLMLLVYFFIIMDNEKRILEKPIDRKG